MFKKRKFLISALLLFLIIVIVNLINYNNKSLTYSEFNNLTENVVKSVLQKNYDKIIIQSPTATIYPGNPEDSWIKADFNVWNNNALTPRNIVAFVIDGEIITRVDMVYTDKYIGREYINVLRISNDTKINLDGNYVELNDMGIEIPNVYATEFTSRNIFFNITTFTSKLSSKDEKYTDKMIYINRDITNYIQEYLLETYEK